SSNPKEHSLYVLALNRNHLAPTQFVTMAHELGHLFLGHLGADPKLRIPDRSAPDTRVMELEAEAVAYIVSARNGVAAASESYLSAFVESDTTVDDLDLYQIMRAAGHVETVLGLNDPEPSNRGKSGAKSVR